MIHTEHAALVHAIRGVLFPDKPRPLARLMLRWYADMDALKWSPDGRPAVIPNDDLVWSLAPSGLLTFSLWIESTQWSFQLEHGRIVSLVAYPDREVAWN